MKGDRERAVIRKALGRAIDALGSQSALAAAMTKAGKKTSQQNVSWWLRAGSVPAASVLVLEAVSKVSRHDLCPDVFPRRELQVA
jgi:DNA-binding transcriptional regulator YdaS (Cro superfamily)